MSQENYREPNMHIQSSYLHNIPLSINNAIERSAQGQKLFQFSQKPPYFNGFKVSSFPISAFYLSDKTFINLSHRTVSGLTNTFKDCLVLYARCGSTSVGRQLNIILKRNNIMMFLSIFQVWYCSYGKD